MTNIPLCQTFFTSLSKTKKNVYRNVRNADLDWFICSVACGFGRKKKIIKKGMKVERGKKWKWVFVCVCYKAERVNMVVRWSSWERKESDEDDEGGENVWDKGIWVIHHYSIISNQSLVSYLSLCKFECLHCTSTFF